MSSIGSYVLIFVIQHRCGPCRAVAPKLQGYMATISSQFPNVRCQILQADEPPSSALDMAILSRVQNTPTMVLLSNEIVELITSGRSGFSEKEIIIHIGVPELDSGLLAFVRNSLEKLMNTEKSGVSRPYSLPSQFLTRR